MMAPRWVLRVLRRLAAGVQTARPPDFIIGGASPGGSYLERWFLIPRNPLCNVYLHRFLRDDDDRALHDHPWPSVSVLLWGEIWEQTGHGPAGWGDPIETGEIVFRRASHAHRIELLTPTATTLFITGPRVREWGFWCDLGARWVHWRDFTAAGAPGEIGRGCE